MPLSLTKWHARYLRQAQWTASVRAFLYRRAALPASSRVLDVGCGTGALLNELVESYARVHGLDLVHAHQKLAMRNSPQAFLTQADAHAMPYRDHTFDLVLCHFLLLWVTEPQRVVVEMARLTRPGGVVIAFAEPDYGGRIDYPASLELLGRWQTDALRQQGADPLVGRKLAHYFQKAGLEDIETGVLGGQWGSKQTPEEIEDEWEILSTDLSETSDFTSNSEAFREQYFNAWQRGLRVLFVPTFYAFGRKGKN